MGDNSAIEWLRGPDGRQGMTWNFVTGCTRVSEGCRNCYIERQTPMRVAGRRFNGGEPGATTGVILHPERLDVPLKKRDPLRIFVNSMSDLWHADVPDWMIARAFAVMAMTPQHTYLVLTKRPGPMRSMLRSDDFWLEIGKHGHDIAITRASGKYRSASPMQLTDDSSAAGPWMPVRPLPNVQIGVSTEDQASAELRIPTLLDTPHIAIRWISAEPLLEQVVLRDEWLIADSWGSVPALDWVVAGGESGPGARPMHPDWPCGLRDQCVKAGIPFFFKQWGEWAPSGAVGIGRSPDKHALVGDPVDEQGHRIEMVRLGKHQAGAVLDGQTWTEYPDA
ncbi:phage Gp37/Gp68 family protein [Nonomuraea sp. NPDC050786]|uniref:phage Gp37/Gp68 family protein n=1 Tax=Nonomuraea sp. NPDC050786 TaxID=3154840 RepID=UPI0033D392D5